MTPPSLPYVNGVRASVDEPRHLSAPEPGGEPEVGPVPLVRNHEAQVGPDALGQLHASTVYFETAEVEKSKKKQQLKEK